MSFLELPAASRRLRQAAKAHSAGEIAREDYRRIRRDIIAELHVEFASSGDALDNFTLGPDSTERRHKQAAIEAQIQQKRGSKKRTPSKSNARDLLLAIAFFAGVLTVFFASGVFANPTSAINKVIPPVKDRDPNPQNSMLLPVSGVRVEVQSPATEISAAELSQQVNNWFAEARAAALYVGGSGFSAAELSELGDLLNRLGVHDQEGLDAGALSALNSLIARQKQRRQLTLAQFELIAEKVQIFFRERGYLAARAYIPAQRIDGDHAVLHVLPGRLEGVVTESTTRLAALASDAFEDQLGSPARANSLESILYRLNSLAGVTATGSLRAGREIGGTTLDLQLSNPSRLSGGVSVDNHGDRRSAKYRLRGILDWRNPLGRGDNLRFEVAQRYESQQATGLGVEYRTPTNRLGDVAAISYTLNDFSVDGSAANLNGRNSTFRLDFERQLFGRRDRSLTAGVAGAFQDLALADLDQKLWWVEPHIAAHRVFDDARWVVRGNASVMAGKLGSERALGQSASFGLLRAELSAWRPLGVQELRLQFSGQIGTDDLPDSLKQRLGGPRRVSAIRPGSFLTDSAFVIGLEMSATPQRLRQYGALGFYTRVGSGHREAANSQASAFAWEGGVVWRLLASSSWTGELRLGIPLSVDGLTESGNENARVFFSLGWHPGAN